LCYQDECLLKKCDEPYSAQMVPTNPSGSWTTIKVLLFTPQYSVDTLEGVGGVYVHRISIVCCLVFAILLQSTFSEFKQICKGLREESMSALKNGKGP